MDDETEDLKRESKRIAVRNGKRKKKLKVRVCVCEREREREKEGEGGGGDKIGRDISERGPKKASKNSMWLELTYEYGEN